MDLTIKLTNDEAEQIIGGHVLVQFRLSPTEYEAKVNFRSYGGVEITLSPKDPEVVAAPPIQPAPATGDDEITF